MASYSDVQIAQFFQQCGKLCQQAQFIVNSFPHVDLFTVTRSIKLLEAIENMLERLEDPGTPVETMDAMVLCVETLLDRLREFKADPPGAYNEGVQTIQTGKKGRPRVDIDLDDVQHLLDMGATKWRIAEAKGVSTKTLSRHMAAAGLSYSREPPTNISDDQLDEEVAKFTIRHPFSGIRITRGYLRTSGITVSAKRIQSSLKRVDPVGVLVR